MGRATAGRCHAEDDWNSDTLVEREARGNVRYSTLHSLEEDMREAARRGHQQLRCGFGLAEPGSCRFQAAGCRLK